MLIGARNKNRYNLQVDKSELSSVNLSKFEMQISSFYIESSIATDLTHD